MSTTSANSRQSGSDTLQRSGSARRVGRAVGHAIAAIFNGLFLYLINVWPGWEILPFLTEDTTRVVGLVNASLIVSLALHLVRVVWAPPRMNALADTVDAVFAVAVVVRLLQVFPLDVPDGGAAELAIRTVLVIVAVGSSIGVVLNLVKFLRGPDRTTE